MCGLQHTALWAENIAAVQKIVQAIHQPIDYLRHPI